ncbi:hypothetical protein GCM10010988_37730 [Cnuibacter physcomitrellae]|uniref:Uncharacterized protein n=1 Tax=Cnuibacter physcomitrellae TaxID=1619308 RepID=A0A1X9LK38_9MICO|nr:DUF6350 family protein [Cnuibacter physcomitrellae]ARJ04668.1 hypothetical protein B5808_05070 [Cnuibacter physcomitrellae]GGI42177.1 hypothetical protein GCM10010988_37730 [Cnuibacter physcomitrellae]
MNRLSTIVLAALDALVAAAIGLGILVVPATLLWAVQFGLALDWTAFWRASADVWLAGHGVDLLITLPSDVALATGLDGAGAPFEVGIALLGFALLTVLLGARSGRRMRAADDPVAGSIAGVVAFGLIATAVSSSARSSEVVPSLLQSALFPAGVYLLGVLIGLAWRRRGAAGPKAPQSRFALVWRTRLDAVDAGDRALVGLALRGGAMAAFGVITVAAVALAIALVAGFSSIVGLYEGLHAQVVGGIALTVGQLALLPNLVVWMASWFLGPGFALGSGSSVSPLGTQLGLLPSVPVFGALPQGDVPLGFAGLLVPVLLAFGVGVVLKPAFDAAVEGTRGRGRWLRFAAVSIALGLVGAVLMALVAIWSGGAAGPGRLADVGPDPSAVFLWSFVEFAVPAALGLLAGASVRRPGTRNGGRDGRGPAAAARSKATGRADTL